LSSALAGYGAPSACQSTIPDDLPRDVRSDQRRPHFVLHMLGPASVAGTAQARIVATLACAVDPDRYRMRAWFLEETGPRLDVLCAAAPAGAVILRGSKDPMDSLRGAQKLRRERLRLRTFTSADAPGCGCCERCLPPDASRDCTATTTKAVGRFRSSRSFTGRTSRSRRHGPSPSRLKMLVAGCQRPFI
jgi:hypothetical protein